MKQLILCILLAATAAGQSTGDYLLQRKTATGYEPKIITPESGKVLSWDGSGNPTNVTPVTSLTWEAISGKPSTFAPSAHSHPLSELSQSGATSGQVPKWNGSAWAPAEDAGGTVDNAAVVAAVADDPAAVREEMIPHDALYGADFGIVAGNSADVVAEANATAIATAYAASSSTGRPLILSGVIYVKGQVLLSGTNGTIIGYGASIVQKDVAHNGLTLAADSGTPPYGIKIKGLSITGQGATTHDAAGIHLRKLDLSYVTSDVNLIDVSIYNFRRGIDIAGVVKFRTENLTIVGCRVGQRWNHLQTSLLTNTRIVSGDGHADSACFEVTGGNFFANKVLMGEFGGANIARFLVMSSGIFHLEAANLESFTADQTFNLTTTGSKYLSIKNCRISCTYTSTDAIISAEVSGNSGQPFLDLQNNWGWSGSPRMLEIYGAYASGGGPTVVSGSSITVTYTATQGGAAVLGQVIPPNIRHFQNTNNFPSPLSTPRMLYDAGSGVTTDLWVAPNELIGYTNRHTGTGEWSAINNNILRRVLYVSGRVASGNNVETDIHNYTLPIGVLANNGESVDIELFGSTAANANNKHFRFYFGGSLYLDFAALPINGESWTLRIRIQRGSFNGGTGYMKLVGTLDYGSGRVIKTAETPNATINSTATIATRVTVLTPTAASDAVSLAAKTVWDRAPQGF